jgi:hypothetical protein
MTSPNPPLTRVLDQLSGAQDQLAEAERIITLVRQTYQYLPTTIATEFRDALDRYDEAQTARITPAGTQPTQPLGIFHLHRCWKCQDGAKPCVNGSPNRCEYPHAIND